MPYWVSISFLLGGALFTIGSFDWMIPSVGGAAAPAWEAAYSVSYPFFVGSLFFLSGCYLSLVEVLNANLQEDIKAVGGIDHLDPSGSLHRRLQQPASRTPSAEAKGHAFVTLKESSDSVSVDVSEVGALHEKGGSIGYCASLRWWGWQPRSILYWGALTQLVGACAFEVSCVAGLPGLIEGHTQARRATQ